MVVPSLVGLCVLALAPYADQVRSLPMKIGWSELDVELDVHAWIVLIHVFDHIPRALCSFTTYEHPTYSHGFLTVLSLPAANELTVNLLRSTPNLAALDASSTALDAVPRTLRHLRVLYLRNCKQITNDILPALLALPLLSVVDLSGTRCTPPDPLFPFAPSTLPVLFQPDIQASLAALASLYDTLPSPLYILNYILPRPPKPVPRKGTQDSFVVFSSSSTKIGNTNSLIYEEENSSKFKRHSSPPPFMFYASRPTPTASPLHLHRPPPPVPSQHISNPRSTSTTTSASLNLQNHKALLARKGIDAFIKLRSTPSTPFPPPKPTSFPSTSTKKNPFKKPTTPLKPISSFTPPVLPPSLIPRDPPKKKPRLSAESTKSFDWKAWGSGS